MTTPDDNRPTVAVMCICAMSGFIAGAIFMELVNLFR